MAEKRANGHSKEEIREARKEYDMVCQIRTKTDLSDAKTALKLYNKLIQDKFFHTMSGYIFLDELRESIIKSGLVAEDTLATVAEQEEAVPEPGKETDRISVLPAGRNRFQKLYEGQKLLNKKLKIAIAALVVLLVGFVFINFKFEYSIFTFFTDYKANMEEELIDKYKSWETELQERQEQIEQKEGAEQDG